MAENAKDESPENDETASTRAGDAVSSFGDAVSTLHEHGKADRKAVRDMARDFGANMMDDAKDLTGKMAEAASKATKDAVDAGAKVASSVSPSAGAAAEAAGKFATQAADAAGKVASGTADAAARVASTVADSAADIADKTNAAAEQTAEQLLAKARADANDWQDRFMRLHAEWDTYRRRTTEQREEERTRANEDLVSNLLPVLDDFERSIEYAVKNGEDGLLSGVEQVHTKLVDVLTKNGVEVIDPKGEEFDALEAQAVAKVEKTDVPDETVDEVYQKGYKMGKKVVRPATVTVTTGGPKREKKPDKEASEQKDK
jgi:molecular chaperone GrpE